MESRARVPVASGHGVEIKKSLKKCVLSQKMTRMTKTMSMPLCCQESRKEARPLSEFACGDGDIAPTTYGNKEIAL